MNRSFHYLIYILVSSHPTDPTNISIMYVSNSDHYSLIAISVQYQITSLRS